jgi:cytochrome c oxidase subunit II
VTIRKDAPQFKLTQCPDFGGRGVSGIKRASREDDLRTTNGRNTRLIALLLIGLGAATASARQGAPDGIQVSARKYEFDPSVIKVKQGDHVKLVITATDRDHGFRLEGYDVEQRLVKGVPTTVEFTADKAGTFAFECSVVCGLGHRKMKGQLVVEPSGGASSSR